VNENGDNLYEYEMIATSRDAPYDKLKVRYSERYGSIVYQEFYTNTGIMLKRAYYEDIVNKDGNTFAKKIRIEDANQKGTSTIVEMLDIKIQDLNDKIFRIEALESLPFVYD